MPPSTGRSEWNGRYCGVEEEEDEILVVQLSHTVSYPGAVMVHPQDAFTTDPAVVHSGLLHQVAFETIAQTIQRSDLIPVSRNSYRLTSPF